MLFFAFPYENIIVLKIYFENILKISLKILSVGSLLCLTLYLWVA